MPFTTIKNKCLNGIPATHKTLLTLWQCPTESVVQHHLETPGKIMICCSLGKLQFYLYNIMQIQAFFFCCRSFKNSTCPCPSNVFQAWNLDRDLVLRQEQFSPTRLPSLQYPVTLGTPLRDLKVRAHIPEPTLRVVPT